MIKKSNRILLFQILPIGILLSWLIIIGLLVWQRVCESHQPPIYDALTYIQKAKSFWDNAAQGWVQNPLNLVQAVRPPGTVLLSYPFGFTNDYHGFLFRTVFVPFVIWIIALLIAVLQIGANNKQQTFWSALLAVFLLGPMPFFFQFEYPTQAYWGLMDGFLAALAVACAGRSLIQKSILWAAFAAFFATFCLLVKPSGSLVLLLTSMFWSGGAIIGIFNSDDKIRSKVVRFWLFGTTIFIVVGGTVSLMCLHSQYLNPEIISYFKQATVILRNEFNTPFTLQFIKSTINSLFGPQFIIAVFALALIYKAQVKTIRFQVSDCIFLAASLLFLLVGGWFWIIASGIAQIRYFYPFALMLILPFVFISIRKLYAMEFAIPKLFKWSLGIACVLPALNLVLLLLVQNPNNQWQNISGVSMNVKSGKAGVEIAKKLQNEVSLTNKSVIVYSLSLSEEISAFNSYGFYQNLISPESPNYSTRLPIDWQRPSTYRICEILEADYLFFEPFTNSEQNIASQMKEINSLDEEEHVIEAFLSSLTPENGLVTKYENQDCRLSVITNKEKLQEAFDIFVRSKSWRPVFVTENEIASALALKAISRKVTLDVKDTTDEVHYAFDKIDISEGILKMTGWGFLERLNSDSLKTYILFKKDEQIVSYNTVLQIRKDLTTGFITTGLNLDSAGFEVKIPVKNFETGNYILGLYIEKGNHAGIMFSDKFVSIDN